MQIRELIIDDIQAIVPLMDELGYPASFDDLCKRFQHLLTLKDYKTFVAELNGEIVGFIGLVKQYAYEFNEPYTRIVALVVSNKYRRQKVGYQLMVMAEQWSLTEGCIAIILNSGNRKERVAAHKFYEKLGYKGKSTGFSKKIN